MLKPNRSDPNGQGYQIYRERMLKNRWLSEETKQKAVKKLDTMKLYIGYPEKVREMT